MMLTTTSIAQHYRSSGSITLWRHSLSLQHVGSTARWIRSLGEGDRAILSWEALRAIAAEGAEVAAHSHTHPQLDRLHLVVLRDEVYRSKSLLEDNSHFRSEDLPTPSGTGTDRRAQPLPPQRLATPSRLTS